MDEIKLGNAGLGYKGFAAVCFISPFHFPYALLTPYFSISSFPFNLVNLFKPM